MKKCINCNNEFIEDHFNQKYCSLFCVNKARHTRNYKKKNRKRERELRAKDYPDKKMFWSVKSRAKTLGIPFDLDISDCQIPEYCAVLGFKLESNVGGKKPKDNSPSLDRLIPALGYVKGNTRVISHRANHIENNGTIDELEKILAYMKREINE